MWLPRMALGSRIAEGRCRFARAHQTPGACARRLYFDVHACGFLVVSCSCGPCATAKPAAEGQDAAASTDMWAVWCGSLPVRVENCSPLSFLLLRAGTRCDPHPNFTFGRYYFVYR